MLHLSRRQLAAGLLALAPFLAGAQDRYPLRPIQLVVPVTPGGVIDTVARMIAPEMTRVLGQSVVVVNKPGAGGNIGTETVAKARPDGYTLLIGYSMFHVGNPSMYPNLSWSPTKDFASVGMIATAPHLMAVHPSVPVSNMKQLVEYARANPGKLSYASSGAGSVPHVGMELLKQQFNLDMVHIPYKGAGPAVQDVVAGNAHVVVMTPPSMLGFIQAGRLKPIVIAGSKRIPQAPDIPAANEAGFPDFQLEAWLGMFAPAGTPPAVIAKLTEALRTALQNPDAKKAADTAGVEIRFLPPSRLDAIVREDYQRWGNVIRSANIRPN